MKNITVRLEEELHEFMRLLSFRSRKSINKLIVELIKELYEKTKESVRQQG